MGGRGGSGWRRRLLLPLWIGLGASLLWLALRGVEPERLLGILRGAILPPLLLAVVVDVGCVAGKALKWQLLLRPVGRVPLLRLQGAIYAGGAAAVVLPVRLDEGVRAYLAARAAGVPVSSVLGSMALERLVDLAALLLALLCLSSLLPLPPVLRGVALASSGLALLLLLGLAVGQLGAARGWLGGLPARLLDGFALGSRALVRPRLLAASGLVAGLEWLGTCAVVGLVAHALGIQLPPAGLLLVTALLFGSFALPLSPAGVGVFQAACALVLPPLFALERVEAVGLALLLHALVLLTVAAIGSGVLVATGVRPSGVPEGGQGQPSASRGGSPGTSPPR